ncbi:MAG: GGDEF domain-containing protein [Vicinamibacterales bacterium]
MTAAVWLVSLALQPSVQAPWIWAAAGLVPLLLACAAAGAVSRQLTRARATSLTDALTGLPNTRFLHMHLARELARAERLASTVALVVLDLDRFKAINDGHGHQVGDRALRGVAAALRATVRPYDVCVRYAGDEFIVVLDGCGAEEAERKRTELQQAVDDLVVDAGGNRTVRLAISAGAALYPHDGRTYDALLAAADARMYADKTRRARAMTAGVRADDVAALPGRLPVPLS